MQDNVAMLEAALANTTRLIAGIGDDQWDRSTPCAKWNVRELVQHTVGVMANFAGAAAGTGVVGDPMDYDLGDNPAETCASAARSCVSSWTQRGELDSIVTLGDNEFPGAVAFNINMLDAYVHGWDVAQATGQQADLDADLCSALLEFSRQVVPEAPREGDNFHAVVPTAHDAGAQAELLGYLGRQP